MYGTLGTLPSIIHLIRWPLSIAMVMRPLLSYHATLPPRKAVVTAGEGLLAALSRIASIMSIGPKKDLRALTRSSFSSMMHFKYIF